MRPTGTASALPLGWPLLDGFVLVEPAAARPLLAALQLAQREARRNGVTLPAELGRLMSALEAVALRQRGESPLSQSAPIEWIPTSEAASRMGISANAVRSHVAAGRLPSRRHGRLVLVDATSVAELAALRSANPRQLSPCAKQGRGA